MNIEDLSKLKIDKSKAFNTSIKTRKRRYWIGALLIIVVIFSLYLKGILKPTSSVTVTRVSLMYPSQSLTVLNASGYVVAQRKASVSSMITSRLVSLMVEEGSHIKKGQVIAGLENQDALAAKEKAEANLKAAIFNLEEAKAELDEAKLLFNRNKDLLARGFLSHSEYDTSEARYKKAVAGVAAAKATVNVNRAAISEANVSLEYAILRAPFDAVVLTKNADVGDIVTPLGAAAEAKAAVVTIADLDSLQVEVDVSESNLTKVKVDQPCEIQLDALPDSRFRGVVHMIVPTADRSKATVMVKVRFLDKSPRILPEMSAKVAFLSRTIKKEEQRPIPVIPQRTVVLRGNKQVVFLVSGDRIIETPVHLGKKFAEKVEVLRGPSVGDRIVEKPSDRLSNGVKVRITAP